MMMTTLVVERPDDWTPTAPERLLIKLLSVQLAILPADVRLLILVELLFAETPDEEA
ncbi:MAG: hypothetical protein J2P55_13350 [Rhizobiales bacterium]|nr:hypothetical protein [Hyphomicrobiales bacterium]